MSEPAPLSTAEALEALVHQFEDPLAFLRELVQNAIDAGSAEIDVYVEYRDAVLEIRVDDYGDGMDRHIIDTRLTRLFSSSKEGDQTKIGRFGIGFVSVFAIDPDAVVLDTARGGECWRVLFRSDRSFERIALRTPVDGTKIRILKRADRARFEEVRRAPEVLARYCRHAEAEIRFHGRPINEPFDLASPCKLAHVEDGSQIVVGYAPGEASGGYYNRGLTLHEEPVAGQVYSFKINSRFLEHTLTRDNVLRDEQHDALMARVRALGEKELPALLFQRIEQAVLNGTADTEVDVLYRFAALQVGAWGEAGRDRLDALRDRRVARALRGEPWSVRALRQRGQAQPVYLTAAASPVAEALAQRGDPTLICAPGSALPELLVALGVTALDAGAAFCRPFLDAASDPARERLAAALLQLLRKAGTQARAVGFARFDAADAARARLAIVQPSLGELTALATACASPFSDRDRPFELAVNADHPNTARLLALAEHEPELAAHLTCKLLLVGGELTPLRDSRLAQLAIEARWQRSKND